MRFRFEPILNLKRHQEENRRFRLKEEEVKLGGIKEELLSLQKTARWQESIVESMGVGKIDTALLACGSEYLLYLRRKQEEVNQQRLIQEAQVAAARDELLSARKETKIMEKLKERFLVRENQETAAREQKVLDEIGINRFYRDKR